MNNKFKLQNFRVFDDKGAEFDIAPITVLTGCNSSGKSTVLKSLMILKPFFNDLKEDYSKGRKVNMNDHELVFNKGKHNLGSFQKTFPNNTKLTTGAQEMTFSWTKYSHLLWEDLRIEVHYKENHKNIFNNAIIERIVVSNDRDEIINLDFSNGFDFRIDYQYLKKNFFFLIEYLKIYDVINDKLGFNKERGVQNTFDNEEEYNELVGKAVPIVEGILYAKNNLIARDEIDKLIRECKEIPEQVLDHKVLLYLPILDWVKDIPKHETYDFICDMIEKSGSDKFANSVIERVKKILKEFEESKFEKFIDFYIKNYEDVLTKCFALPKIKATIKGRKYDKEQLINDSLWKLNFGKLKGDEEVIIECKNMLLEDMSNDFISNINNYLSIDYPWMQQHNFDILFLNNFLELEEPSKNYWDFMALSIFCNDQDENFGNKRHKAFDYRPIGNPAEYFETIEYNAAVKYILAVIQDSIFNPPSFIENIEFVEAVRANVQRIYAFNQDTDFNELLLSYLNNPTKSIEYSPKKRDKVLGFVVAEDGKWQFFVKPKSKEINEVNKEGNSGYKLGTFMRKWLRKFDIADDIIFENTQEGLGVLIYLIKNGSKELLADQGYGITQFIAITLKIETVILESEYSYSHPLIMSSSLRYKESTISIEEPETNLHPKFQSLLADMFMDAYKTYNVRFIIETHSEYLIRKLQTLVAKKELTPDNVALHYIYHHDKTKRPTGKPQVLNIKINEDGRLSEPFGAGFFDEADNLAMDLLTIKSLN